MEADKIELKDLEKVFLVTMQMLTANI